jgi:hypothetical protein
VIATVAMASSAFAEDNVVTTRAPVNNEIVTTKQTVPSGATPANTVSTTTTTVNTVTSTQQQPPSTPNAASITMAKQIFPDVNLQSVVTVIDLKDLLLRFARCNNLQGIVVEYSTGAPVNSKLWMTASTTDFCRVAILPDKVDKPIICNFTAQDVSRLMSDDNVALINHFDPKKNNPEDLLPMVTTLLDCYKRATVGTVPPQPAANQVPVTNGNTTTEPHSNLSTDKNSGNNQPAREQNYDYGKMLQQ